MKHLMTMLLLLPGIVRAQDAVVVQLTSEEAAQARALHAEADEAEKAWERYRNSIEKKYTMSKGTDCSTGGLSYWGMPSNSEDKCAVSLPGWQNSTMEFTPDFRFIVPRPIPYVQQQPSWTIVKPANNQMPVGGMGWQTDQQ